MVADSPLVDRPIVAVFDEQGRLYVADSSGSNADVRKHLEEKPHRIGVLFGIVQVELGRLLDAMGSCGLYVALALHLTIDADSIAARILTDQKQLRSLEPIEVLRTASRDMGRGQVIRAIC